ncbi:helix-turn-helix domain-containing protein [Candidatus Phycosocius bacilliformis]|nr:helix-turn-helix domain-containing protein [Candidatus Phycosocius bacilliformis]
MGHADRIDTQKPPRFHETPARIMMAGARAAYVGPGLDLAPHRTAVAVIALGLDQPFSLTYLDGPSARSDEASRSIALIRPGRLHHLTSRAKMAFIYLDALSDDFTSLDEARLEAAGDRLKAVLSQEGRLDDLCAALDLPQHRRADPRLAHSLRMLDQHPDAFAQFADLAQACGLSPSHCRTLFKQTAGVCFRRYRIWRRMASVAKSLALGHSLTEAAYAAGFASSAHLSFAFNKMFGLSPTALIKAGVRFELD